MAGVLLKDLVDASFGNMVAVRRFLRVICDMAGRRETRSITLCWGAILYGDLERATRRRESMEK